MRSSIFNPLSSILTHKSSASAFHQARISKSSQRYSTRVIEQRGFCDSNKINRIFVEGFFGKPAKASSLISNRPKRIFAWTDVLTRESKQRRFYVSNKINRIFVEGVFGEAAKTSFFISNRRERVFTRDFVAQQFSDRRLRAG
jgi:hypothetical protein